MTKHLPLASQTPPFTRIAIVGFGLVGGSLGLAIKQRWPSALIIAVDRRDVIETAMRMHAADVGGDDLIMIGGAELVVLAAPVRQNIQILQQLADVLEEPAVVTDMGSTKTTTVAAGTALPPHLAFIGGHPLAGAAASGVEAARADLFEQRPWILTTPASVSESQLTQLRTLIDGVGARVHEMSAEDHDRVVSYLSHLPQLTVTALMHVVGHHVGVEGLALAGRGLRDTTRLASSPVQMWRDVSATNAANIGAALDDLIVALQVVRAQLSEPGPEFERLFASANQWKAALDGS